VKTTHDPRHQHRIALVKLLYAYSFTGEIDEEIKSIVEKLELIDAQIKKVATNWDISGINKVDLAILRLGVFELEKKELTANIIIDEAIEIAKEYGADASKNFVNAVLSKVATHYEHTS
jgi:N utilization substance protein B